MRYSRVCVHIVQERTIVRNLYTSLGMFIDRIPFFFKKNYNRKKLIIIVVIWKFRFLTSYVYSQTYVFIINMVYNTSFEVNQKNTVDYWIDSKINLLIISGDQNYLSNSIISYFYIYIHTSIFVLRSNEHKHFHFKCCFNYYNMLCGWWLLLNTLLRTVRLFLFCF